MGRNADGAPGVARVRLPRWFRRPRHDADPGFRGAGERPTEGHEGDPLVTAVVSRRRPSLLGNMRAVISAQVAIKAVNVVVAVAMVRWLGAEELGRYAYVIAFAFPFGALAEDRKS